MLVEKFDLDRVLIQVRLQRDEFVELLLDFDQICADRGEVAASLFGFSEPGLNVLKTGSYQTSVH